MPNEPIRRNRYAYNNRECINEGGRFFNQDFDEFHLPVQRVHLANLEDWGVAQGLMVSGSVGDKILTVEPGVAITANGELISLSAAGSGSLGKTSPTTTPVPIKVDLSEYQRTVETTYTITITFQELEQRESGHPCDRLLVQAPWIRLQPVSGETPAVIDGTSVPLGQVVITPEGKILQLSPTGRRLAGKTVEQLVVRRPQQIGDQVTQSTSGQIGPAPDGGLRVTVPQASDGITLAQANGNRFAQFEVQAEATNLKGNGQIEGSLQVMGATMLQNNLFVNSGVNIGETLQVTGPTTLQNNLFVNSGVSIGETLQVTGSTTLQNNLFVNSGVNIGETLQVTGPTTLQNNLFVSGDVSVGDALQIAGPISVGGSTNVNQTLQVMGSATLQDNLSVRGGTSIGSTLQVAGVTTLQNNLSVGGDTDFRKTVRIAGNLEVQGNVIARDAEHIAGNVAFGDADTDEVSIAGVLRSRHSSGALTVDDALQLTGSLTVTGTGGRNYFKDSEKADGLGLRVGAAWGMYGIYAETGRGTLGGAQGVSLQNNSLIVGSNGNVGIGTASPNQALTIKGTFNAGKDANNQMQNGGNLAIVSNAPQIDFVDTDNNDWAIHVNSNKMYFIREPWEHSDLVLDGQGNIGIGIASPEGKLDVRGDIRAGNSDLYFTKTDHNHTGIGNTSGYAAIENASDHNALMILGRAGTDKGRYVKLWDYLQVNGSMDVTGNLGVGTSSPSDRLDVNGWMRLSNGGGINFFNSANNQYWQIYPQWGDAPDPDLMFDYSNKQQHLGWVRGWLDPQGGWNAPSDVHLKRDIQPLCNVLDAVMKLQPRSYQWVNSAEEDAPKQIGFISQEIEEVFPDFVNKKHTFSGINYHNFTVVAIAAIQEQQALIIDLKKEIADLKASLT